MKTQNTIIVCFVLFVSSLAINFVQSQEVRAYYWAFGNMAGLDFSTGSPVADTTSMKTYEGSASICDLSGNLQMYTNGGGRDLCCSGGIFCQRGRIWNMNHNVIPGANMDDEEGGGNSAAQSSIIIPKPGSASNYYVFCMEEFEASGGLQCTPGFPFGRGFTYYEIDMSMNGGTGGVVQANQQLHPKSFESVTATKHANGTDWWVIIHTAWYTPTDSFLVYKVTGTGVESPVEIPHQSGIGNLYASPDGNYIAAGGQFDIGLYPFDNVTGMIDTNYIDAGGYVCGFSPNAKLGYIMEMITLSEWDIFQVDLTVPDIPASKVFIGTFHHRKAGNMQIGPDHKIYIGQANDDQLSVIHCPNQRGAACNFEENAVTLAAGTRITSGFINLPQCWFYSNDSCGGTVPVEFVDFAGNNVGSVNLLHWTTASETNNDVFVVQRAGEAKKFEAIGTVKGAGNTNSLSDYTYSDSNPREEFTYYRLKQVDFDGSFLYSETIAVGTKNPDNHSMNISSAANGTGNILKFTGYAENETVVVNMYDITARLAYTCTITMNTFGSGILELGREHIPGGIYIVKTISGKSSYSEKVVMK